jgi:hypothetical protein
MKNHSYNHKQISTGKVITEQNGTKSKRVLTEKKLDEISVRPEHSP